MKAESAPGKGALEVAGDDDNTIVTLTADELARHAELFFNFGVTYAAMQAYGSDREIRELAREVWKTPRYAELERRRQHSDEPCGIRTCRGCSRCVRADAVRSGAVRS